MISLKGRFGRSIPPTFIVALRESWNRRSCSRYPIGCIQICACVSATHARIRRNGQTNAPYKGVLADKQLYVHVGANAFAHNCKYTYMREREREIPTHACTFRSGATPTGVHARHAVWRIRPANVPRYTEADEPSSTWPGWSYGGIAREFTARIDVLGNVTCLPHFVVESAGRVRARTLGG